jgi:hypothetical protein
MSVVGKAVATAVDAGAARTALGFKDGVKAYRTRFDLRDVDAVRDANWTTCPGVNAAAGATQITNFSTLKSTDVGKIVMAPLSAGKWWMSKIVSVSGTTATVDVAAPEAISGPRIRYGFDGTKAINDALTAVSAVADGPVEVLLGGNYRLTQLIIPAYVVLRGVPWRIPTVMPLGTTGKTYLAQLPGAEKDFVIFGENPDVAGTLMGSGLSDLQLQGPEKTVVGVPAATKGNGVSFRIDGHASGLVIDGFQLHNVSAVNFPESGFKCFGAVPFYVNECKGLQNGRYGFEYHRAGTSSCNALHFFNFSADWNNLGALGFKDLQSYDTVFVSGLKSEGHITGAEADATRGGPGFQSTAIVFEDCPDTPVVLNGVSHLRVGRAGIGPGPVIHIKDTTKAGRKPRLAFNAVIAKVSGLETGTVADAVTIRDESTATKLDVPRTVTSGYYPVMTAPHTMVDDAGKNHLIFASTPNATASLVVYNNASGNPPIITVNDKTQANVSLALTPKGAGSIQINGAAGQPARINAAGPSAVHDLDLNGKGVGAQVLIAGNPAGSRVAVPASASAPGKPGNFAADATHIYTYTGNGTTGTWVRAAAATW